MRLAIDASNIRAGGGITHLSGLLGGADPEEFGFREVSVWASAKTLAQLPDRPWLDRRHDPLLDHSLPHRILWQRRSLPREIRSGYNCLFVPGGTYYGDFAPMVAMSQNLLPFDMEAQANYGAGRERARLALLRRAQRRTFRQADGVVFLTPFARSLVLADIPIPIDRTRVVPHGISPRFFTAPRAQLDPEVFSEERPFRLLYVSTVDRYKHQSEVVSAVAELRRQGLPLSLDLIGTAVDRRSTAEMISAITAANPKGNAVRYLGGVPYDELPSRYLSADGFVFASSCETFGQILLEAMASGLPIASSGRSSLPDMLGQAGTYFDPTRPADIAAAIKRLFESAPLRTAYAEEAFSRAKDYSWSRCASETFVFLAEATTSHRRNHEPLRVTDQA